MWDRTNADWRVDFVSDEWRNGREAVHDEFRQEGVQVEVFTPDRIGNWAGENWDRGLSGNGW